MSGDAPQGRAPAPPGGAPPAPAAAARDPLDPAAPQPSLPPRLRPRRAQTLAALLPMLGAFLLAPPFIVVFSADVSVVGVPLVLAYMLAVWVGLIFGTWRLSGRLSQRLALSPGRVDPALDPVQAPAPAPAPAPAQAPAPAHGPRRAP
jgi:hypothetical protein